MFDLEMQALIDAHLACQSGCYFSGIEVSGRGSRYAYSRIIPDTGWNFCIPSSIDDRQFGLTSAGAMDRQPAFLVSRDIAEIWPEAVERAPEHWMLHKSSSQKAIARPSIITEVREISSADPGKDFGRVFSALFMDEQLNRHFQDFYVSALRSATQPKAANPLHLVAYVDEAPVCCASLYITNRYAGLYNVGTDASFQRQGLG